MSISPCSLSPQELNAKSWHEYGAHSETPAVNSIRAPLGIRSPRIEWNPIPITELGEYVAPSWLWPGYIARGHTTLLIGLWKAGKSTLLAHLLRELNTGGALVPQPEATRVLVVTEESASIWRRRREDLDLSGSVHLLCRPFKGRADGQEWQRFVVTLAELVRTHGFGLVIIDTLSSVWPVQDENNASEVGTALLPLNLITDAGAGLLLVHHPRKGGGGQGQATRGSGALPSFVDIIVELSRHSPNNSADCRRMLTTYSRFEESQLESVIELKGDRYTVIGGSSEARKVDRLQMLENVLPLGEPGSTVVEILEKWPHEPKPGKRCLKGDLSDGVKQGRWNQGGKGCKGDAHRYWKSQFDSGELLSIGARIESHGTEAPSLGLAAVGCASASSNREHTSSSAADIRYAACGPGGTPLVLHADVRRALEPTADSDATFPPPHAGPSVPKAADRPAEDK